MVFSGVLEKLTGAPAVGWTVRLQDAAGDDYDAPVAADGSFSISVNAGSYDLMVFDEFGNEVETDNVALSESMTGVTLTLPPLQALTLTAVDGSGDPISGAEVGSWIALCTTLSSAVFDVLPGVPATSFSAAYDAGQLTTDASGSVNGALLPCAAATYTASVSASGYASYTTPSGGLPLPADGDVTAVLPVAKPTFSGVVDDAQGNPLAGIEVQGTVANTAETAWEHHHRNRRELLDCGQRGHLHALGHIAQLLQQRPRRGLGDHRILGHDPGHPC